MSRKVLVTPGASGIGDPFRSHNTSIKWAIVGLTKILAMEASARGETKEAIRESYVKGVSLRTWVTARDVANSIHFLASEAGARISGQILAIDGHTETLAP
jgi:NAD(P)-dependent dehydrogenase (short-subunit alcohol dehydrogenase family)